MAYVNVRLPLGCEERHSPNGRHYFIDHRTRLLPSGSEMRMTSTRHIYFVNHNTRRSMRMRGLRHRCITSATTGGRSFTSETGRRWARSLTPSTTYTTPTNSSWPRFEGEDAFDYGCVSRE
ncbi:hypothetical protein EDB87DRAFT_1003476 [Lactarius vividus]|nr:hypothetical protein EDB87DRAFT_1003476 [Lactarius vividus]